MSAELRGYPNPASASFRRTPESSPNMLCVALETGFCVLRTTYFNWIPAFAGMTVGQNKVLRTSVHWARY
jgi:hypothetical protein